MKLSKWKLRALLIYNKISAKKRGWEPYWLGAKEFDEGLITKIKTFQIAYDLEPDGMVGPMTYTRMMTEQESKTDIFSSGSFIVCNGSAVPIEWPKVVVMSNPDGLGLPQGTYKKHPTKRKPTMIVVHWDAALSAKSCHRILKKKGISSHFVIDNDGTIYQMVDTNHQAWHGGRKVNHKSIGIDFSNAYYTKYQKWYTKRGFGRRPVLNSKVHGRKVGTHLGYYQIQEEAFKALIEALTDHYEIPLEVPKDSTDKLLLAVDAEAARGNFEGVVCHYHLTRKKIDCAGLELDRLVEEVEFGE